MDLEKIVNDVAHVLKKIDDAGECFKTFHPGVGPYGEPQLVKLVATRLSGMSGYEVA